MTNDKSRPSLKKWFIFTTLYMTTTNNTWHFGHDFHNSGSDIYINLLVPSDLALSLPARCHVVQKIFKALMRIHEFDY